METQIKIEQVEQEQKNREWQLEAEIEQKEK